MLEFGFQIEIVDLKQLHREEIKWVQKVGKSKLGDAVAKATIGSSQ